MNVQLYNNINNHLQGNGTHKNGEADDLNGYSKLDKPFQPLNHQINNNGNQQQQQHSNGTKTTTTTLPTIINNNLNGHTHDNFSYPYDVLHHIATYLLERTEFRPKIGIICGSGLGPLADMLTDTDVFPYEKIPSFPVSTVEGHAGRLLFGHLKGVPVICMQGRFHYYEGYSLSRCSMPVRVMKLIGVTHLLLTNAAGGVNPKYKVGDIAIVRDHINFMGFAGNTPLLGPNDVRFGPRFPAMNNAYDPQIIRYAMSIAKEMKITDVIHQGVYTCLGGPNYETVAEIRMLKAMGVDAVGMSTVHEVLTARHCDIKAFAFSIITNRCATEYDVEEEANHEEVVTVCNQRQGIISEFACRLVKKMYMEEILDD